MIRKSLVCGVLVLMTGSVWAASLDGTNWQVKVIPDPMTRKLGEHSFGDKLSFKNGKVTASECTKYGFGASDYKTADAPNQTSWDSTMTSAKEGNSKWIGEVKGNEIAGDMIWTKPGGHIFKYKFRGKKGA